MWSTIRKLSPIAILLRSSLLLVCSVSVLLSTSGAPALAAPAENSVIVVPQPPKFIENVTMPPAPASMEIPLCKLRLTAEQMRSGIPGENRRWRSGFFVQMDSRFSEAERAIINNALYEIHINLCIDVLLWPIDSSPTGDYVFIVRGGGGTGCWSYVGKTGGRQELNLEAPGCVHQGVAMHEAIHALGFFHEQSRPDRDQHVEILWGNISPGLEYAFDRYDDTLTYDVPYDYRSIMHYNSHDFSSNGQPTIRAWNGNPVGSEHVLTGNDKLKLNRMYNC